MDDVALAEALVRAAGDVVLAARERPLGVEAKTGATDLVTAADRDGEAAMVALLERARPDDGVRGEEGADAGGRPRTWLLDPLDGTLNFVAGLPAFCCAAALVGAEGPIAAAVLDPLAGELFTAGTGTGAVRAVGGERAPLRLDGASVPPLSAASIATFVDRERQGGAAALAGLRGLVERAGTLRITGSGTLELAWVAAGRLHGWAQPDVREWDWHPGALLVAEAGGAVGTVERAGTRWRLAAAGGALLDDLAAAVAA